MRSNRIVLHDEEKLKQVNKQTIEIFERYKIDMMMRNLSENTQQHYIWDLQQWFIYILDNQGNKSIVDLNDDDITEFIFFCMQKGNNSERIKVRICTISAIYRFMRKKKIILVNPIEFIDRPKKCVRIVKQTYLTNEQVALMREKLIDCGNMQLRLYAMISLSTMARSTVISSLRWNQVDFDAKIIHDVLEKEGKIVDLFFSDEVKCLLQLLKAEREEKGINDYGFIFKGKKANTHINRATLNTWSKKIGEMIGIPTLHPHDFRHSGATLLKNAGMPLEDVSELLSHESTDTTKKYYIKQDIQRIGSAKRVYNI